MRGRRQRDYGDAFALSSMWQTARQSVKMLLFPTLQYTIARRVEACCCMWYCGAM
jgi:hypothetical protein